MLLGFNGKAFYTTILILSVLLLFQSPKMRKVFSIPECDECGNIIKNLSVPPIEQPTTVKITVKPGDSFISILKSVGLSDIESHHLTKSLQEFYNVDKIKHGDQITLSIDTYNDLSNFKIQNQFLVKNIAITKDQNNNYSCSVINSEKRKKLVRVSDTISHSLFNTIADNGLPAPTIMRLVDLYNGSIDLKKQILPGSKVDVLLERLFDEDGDTILDDEILYTSLKVKKKYINVYRHLLKNGKYGYFDSEGKNIKRSVLQLPININNVRISSRFGNRLHPIHGCIKLHKGVDYVAPIGTPIVASADGIIEYIGTKSGYGKYIKIKHNNDYSTAYAHINNFHNGLTRGSSVKQGQIIAYVGNSGSSTAPHLHYEVLYKGIHIDPQKVVEIDEITVLPEIEIPLFKSTIRKIHNMIDEENYNIQLAVNE